MHLTPQEGLGMAFDDPLPAASESPPGPPGWRRRMRGHGAPYHALNPERGNLVTESKGRIGTGRAHTAVPPQAAMNNLSTAGAAPAALSRQRSEPSTAGRGVRPRAGSCRPRVGEGRPEPSREGKGIGLLKCIAPCPKSPCIGGWLLLRQMGGMALQLAWPRAGDRRKCALLPAPKRAFNPG